MSICLPARTLLLDCVVAQALLLATGCRVDYELGQSDAGVSLGGVSASAGADGRGVIGSDGSGSASATGGSGGTSDGGTSLGGTVSSTGGQGSGTGIIDGCTTGSYAAHDYAFCGFYASQEDATAACDAAGMTLARVDSAEENAFIVSSAVVGEMSVTSGVWLGAIDPDGTREWRWQDGDQFWSGDRNGSSVDGLYANWRPNHEPSNPDERCAVMRLADGYWNDAFCTSSAFGFVCEAP